MKCTVLLNIVLKLFRVKTLRDFLKFLVDHIY
jgi:hypothetical protein